MARWTWRVFFIPKATKYKDIERLEICATLFFYIELKVSIHVLTNDFIILIASTWMKNGCCFYWNSWPNWRPIRICHHWHPLLEFKLRTKFPNKMHKMKVRYTIRRTFIVFTGFKTVQPSILVFLWCIYSDHPWGQLNIEVSISNETNFLEGTIHETLHEAGSEKHNDSNLIQYSSESLTAYH